MTSFITLLVTGNDVYLIYHSFRIFFSPLPHLASYISYSSILPCTKTKEKWHCTIMPVPQSHQSHQLEKKLRNFKTWKLACGG